MSKTAWIQVTIRLKPRPRGFHLVTDELASAVSIKNIRFGIAHFFIQHTSASLTINENADPNVRADFESHFNRAAPEDAPYRHTTEGKDDMPAHLKASLLGSSVSVPIENGQLKLGIWQGIYLGEHRDHGGGAREVVVTVFGEERFPA